MMPSIPARRYPRFAACITLTVLGGILAAKSHAQTGKLVEYPNEVKTSANRLFLGVMECVVCHARAENRPFEDKDVPPLSRCTEATVWKNRDPHARAFQALLGDRARKMASTLKIADATKDSICLSC